jgi:hypothetical protein
MSETASIAGKTQKKQSLAAIIAASSVGTMIEWYDFYIFGSLATIIATKFSPQEIQPLPSFPLWLRLQPVL